jgi:hypothetical protein
MPPGCCDGDIVTGIRMANDADTGVGGEDPLETNGSLRGAIGDDDLTGMLAVTDAHPAAMVE